MSSELVSVDECIAVAEVPNKVEELSLRCSSVCGKPCFCLVAARGAGCTEGEGGGGGCGGKEAGETSARKDCVRWTGKGGASVFAVNSCAPYETGRCEGEEGLCTIIIKSKERKEKMRYVQ